MNNNFRQTQYTNNNNFINGYQNFRNTNTPFSGNVLLSNNPMFFGSIHDPNFQNNINIAKMEQRSKIKSLKDLNLSKEQLSSYVIDPIKIVRQGEQEILTKYDSRRCTYISRDDAQNNFPALMMEWYNSRTNNPYKNILKNENYKKIFKNMKDLIVHTVTQLDKDKIRFAEELAEKKLLFEEHDGELKLLFSLSQQAEHAKNFEYVQKYKHRIKYNPENFNDLKQYYKNETKRINNENKRIDEMLEMLIMNDGTLTQEELNQIQVPITEYNNDLKMKNVFKQGEKEIEKQLEKQLIKELGHDQFNEIMKELDVDEPKQQKRRAKIKQKIPSNTSSNDDSNETKLGSVSTSDLEKYRNRKKTNN